jgi:hypothetical protein
LVKKLALSAPSGSGIAFDSPDILFPDEIIQRLVYGSEGPLVPRIHLYLLPDAHTVGTAFELEYGQEKDLFVARHEFIHNVLQ